MKEEKTLNTLPAEHSDGKTDNEEMPSMNVSLPSVPDEEKVLIEDEVMLGVYDEVLDNIRQDRGEIDELLSNFLNMVMNEGDSTTSSKEAVVNLIKIKADTADKMVKIADLMTRIKLKETNTFPRYLAAHQNNTINIKRDALTPAEKRALIENENKKISERDGT